MRRIQLFEFHERMECPKFVRDSVVETLGQGLRRLDMVAALGPAFSAFRRQSRCERVLDLCSGSGAPTSLLLDWLRERGNPLPRFVLSDLLPNEGALSAAAARHPGHVAVARSPVDATQVPEDVEHDARTIINAFHHFSPAQAAHIVADAVAQRKALFIYEGFPRDVSRFLPTGPAMFPGLLFNPITAREQRLAKAFFTYVLPIIPIVAAWDGLVSVLRIHSEDELRAMAGCADDYRWDYAEIPYARGCRAVVFSGIPHERC
jgi:hypothetical protein